MENKQCLQKIVAPLLAWYAQHARILPWRENAQAYRVWVSEIMLQQTRVETVKPYFERFMSELPTIASLAAVSEERLLKLWEGLGYYSRARNLKRAAEMIMREYGGQLPSGYDALVALPGIGAYTAGAILSIAFGMRTPAVDGNVIRVVSRLTGGRENERSQITESLRAVYPQENCGDFTQSLMELGATVCLPNGAPHCAVCPLAALCEAFRRGQQSLFPIKEPKRERRKEAYTVLILRCKDMIALEKRDNRGVLRSMWGLPMLEGHLAPSEAADLLGNWTGTLCPSLSHRHVFTHIEWDMISLYAAVDSMPTTYQWFLEREIESSIALPTAFRVFL